MRMAGSIAEDHGGEKGKIDVQWAGIVPARYSLAQLPVLCCAV
jgi:hypothetical protein